MMVGFKTKKGKLQQDRGGILTFLGLFFLGAVFLAGDFFLAGLFFFLGFSSAAPPSTAPSALGAATFFFLGALCYGRNIFKVHFRFVC